jgi:hypothetical protein
MDRSMFNKVKLTLAYQTTVITFLGYGTVELQDPSVALLGTPPSSVARKKRDSPPLGLEVGPVPRMGNSI